MSGQRSQSEVLGFALVFALVLSTVAFISVFGFGSLEDARDREELNNAERAFDVLADNMADIHEEGAPSRATEISLQNAELSVGDPISMNLTLTGSPGENASISVEPIVFRIGDTEIVYASGAILRSQRDGGVMVKEPPFLLDEERIVMPMIETINREGVTSTTGGTVRVRAVNIQRRFEAGLVENPAPYDRAIVNVTSPRHEIWERYFEEQDNMSCVTTSLENNMRCSISDPNAVYVSKVGIEWEIET